MLHFISTRTVYACTPSCSGDAVFDAVQVDVHAYPHTPSPTTSTKLPQCSSGLGPVWWEDRVLPGSSWHLHGCTLEQLLLYQRDSLCQG